MISTRRSLIFVSALMGLPACVSEAADPAVDEIAAANVAENDADHDGVRATVDCDDGDPTVGKLLYYNDFSTNTRYFENSSTLSGEWIYGDGQVGIWQGGQQAYLGPQEAWTDTVTYVTLSGNGAATACEQGRCVDRTTSRFRAGIVARMSPDADQDEGFHGYRCAIAQNDEADCFAPGPFVQLAAFLDAPEDDVNSECTVGCPPNPTFDQLARVRRSKNSGFMTGDAVALTFWAVGDDLVCDMMDKHGDHFVAMAQDQRFASGGIGLSTLNALTNYEKVRVCQAFRTP